MKKKSSETRRRFLRHSTGALGLAALPGTLGAAKQRDRPARSRDGKVVLLTEENLRAYLVYDRENGKIMHRHRQPAELEAQVGDLREHILNLVDPSLDRGQLDILVLDENEIALDGSEIRAGMLYQVDPSAKRLEVARGGQPLDGGVRVWVFSDET